MNIQSRCALLLVAGMMLAVGHAAMAAGPNPQTLFSFCKNATCPGGYAVEGMIRGPDGAYYGTARYGGIPVQGDQGGGTVYRLDPTTHSISVVHQFDPHLEGRAPSILTLGSDGNFYGALSYGAVDANGNLLNGGCLFRLSPEGAFTSLFTFSLDGSDGFNQYFPSAPLVEDGLGNWYGTTTAGGAYNSGTVYEYSHDGIFQILHSFSACQSPNADGCQPNGLVLANDGNFYGTTREFGGNQEGTIFRIAPDGTFATLYSFTAYDGGSPTILVNGPNGALYGVTGRGGIRNVGTMFSLSLQGEFTSLYSFLYSGYGGPSGGLTLMPDGYFYGVRAQGGPWGYGAIYRISPSGSNYRPLYSFRGGNDGAGPSNVLLNGFDNALYGSTSMFGKYGKGTIFRYVPPPLP